MQNIGKFQLIINYSLTPQLNSHRFILVYIFTLKFDNSMDDTLNYIQYHLTYSNIISSHHMLTLPPATHLNS